ncbi:hypothetical protein D3C72_1098000 [compost metagenome]
MRLQHPFGPLPVTLLHAVQPVLQPLAADLIIFPTVVKFLQPCNRHGQSTERLANLLLQLAQFGFLKPLILLLNSLNMFDLLLQNAGADLAHLSAPLLPGLLEVMIETLSFLPFSPVQAHHFFIRQLKLQLAPDDAALASNLNQLIERNKVFMLFTAHLDPGVQQPHAVIRMLSQVFPQRCRFKFHIFAP